MIPTVSLKWIFLQKGSVRLGWTALQKTLEGLIGLQALQKLVALLLLARYIAHLKTHDVIQNLLMHLVLNV